MFSKLYFHLKDKIQELELRLSGVIQKRLTQTDGSRLFYFSATYLNFKLIVLEILSDFVKFFVVIFADPAQGFSLFYNQRDLQACPYSYSGFRQVQRKIRTFSLAGLATIVTVAVISSLITNLIFGGKAPTWAASYGWTQGSWSGGASSTAYADHSLNRDGQAPWNWFEAKSDYLVAANSIQLLAQLATSTQTTDADFGLGVASGTVVAGAGMSGNIVLDKKISDISVGNFNVLALKTDGSVWGWGNNSSGELSLGDYSPHAIPAIISSLGYDNTSIKISNKGWYVLKGNGKVYAHSVDNTYGSLGTGNYNDSSVPVQVGAGVFGFDNNVAAIFSNDTGALDYAFATDKDGYLWGWGYNGVGQNSYNLGLGDLASRPTPVKIGVGIANFNNIIAMSLSRYATKALTKDGRIFAWGNCGYQGLCGDLMIPGEVTSLGTDNVSLIGNGGDLMVLKSNGTVMSAGWNDSEGRLGQNGSPGSPTFGYMANMSGWNVVAAAQSGSFSLVQKSDGTVWGVGGNGYFGMLPKQVTSLGTNTLKFSGNNNTALFIKSNGDLVGFGLNSYYQLGIGNNSPVATSSLTPTILSVGSQYAPGTFTSPVLDLGRNTIPGSLFFSFDRTLGTAGSNAVAILVSSDAANNNLIPDASNMGDPNSQTFLGVGTSSAFQAGGPSIIRLDDGKYRIYFHLASPDPIGGVNYNRLVYRETTNYSFPQAGNLGTMQELGLGVSTTSQAANPDVERLPDGKYRLYYQYTSRINPSDSTTAFAQLAYRDTTNNVPPQVGNLGSQVLLGTASYSSSTQTAGPQLMSYINGVSQTKYRLYYNYASRLSPSDPTSGFWQLAYRETDNIPDQTSFNAATEQFLGVGVSSTSNSVSPMVIRKPDNSGYRLYYYLNISGGIYGQQVVYRDTTDSNPPNNTSGNIGSMVYLNSSLSSLSQDVNPYILTIPAATGNHYVLYTQSNKAGFSWDISYRESWNFFGSNDNQYSDCSTPANCYTASSALTSVHNGASRYRYKAFLQTDDQAVSPSLDEVRLIHQYYPATSSLTGSWYNTSDDKNILTRISWSEDILMASGTRVKIQIRTASSTDGTHAHPASTTASAWQGPDGTSASYFTSLDWSSCSKLSGSVSCQIRSTSTIGDGVDDRWVQYQVTLESAGDYTPIADNVSLQYVVNNNPAFEPDGFIASQSTTTGQVEIYYAVLDSDTDTASLVNRFKASISLQYWNGADWISASSSLITHYGGTSTLAVSTSTYATSSLLYDVKKEPALMNQYYASTSGLQLRLVANDGELANNLGYATTSIILDTIQPATGLIVTNASVAPAELTLGASDNSHFMMKISLDETIFDLGSQSFDATAWQEYAATTSIAVTASSSKVYMMLRDDYDNYATTSADIPSQLRMTMIQDTSNIRIDPPEYRLFISWKRPDSPPSRGFKRYNIYRSDNAETGFVLLASTTNFSVNYFTDTTMESGTSTYYRATLEDNDGSISYQSLAMWGNADGNQNAGEGGGGVGTAGVPPTISNISSSSITTSEATIEWDTDTLSDSLVMFKTDSGAEFSTTSGNVSSQGVASLMDMEGAGHYGRHKVTLTGLLPETTYYFKVQSIDIHSSVSGTHTDTLGIPLVFTTLAGPRIINVDSNKKTANSATINWQTIDNSGQPKLANSRVDYSVNQDMSSSTEVGVADEQVSDHSIVLSGLISGKTYYYVVRSDTAIAYQTYANGKGEPYQFTTSNDILPPAISLPSCQITTTDGTTTPALTIRASTTEPAIYSLEFGMMENAYEQQVATTTNFNIDHVVILENLLASTTYHFRYALEDENGNIGRSIDFNCSTGEQLKTEQELQEAYKAGQSKGTEEGISQGKMQQAGGGAIIIDKTDKVAPIISNIQTANLTATSVVIGWTTSEEANGFLEYGAGSVEQGETLGQISLATVHRLAPRYLLPNTKYQFRISSADSSGNLARSEPLSFTTPDLTQAEVELVASTSKAETQVEKETLLKSVADKAIEMFNNLSGQVSLGSLQNTIFSQYDALDKLAQLIPAPILGGEPAVEITPSTATIKWKTDKQANSMVAYAPEGLYSPSKGSRGYLQLVGEPNQSSVDHAVKIVGLKPDSVYHYQLRSKAKIGIEAASRDFVFRTKPEALEIISVNTETLSKDKAKFSWLTSQEADTELTYTPYRDGKLSPDEAKSLQEKTLTTNHEAVVTDLEAGVIYEFQINATNRKGIKINKIISFFSTTKDDLPPEITDIKTESALSQSKDAKVQTIMTWTTSEPTISQIKYGKGVFEGEEDLTEVTPMEVVYSRKHTLVITKFEIGEVYTFRVVSTDSGGNTTVSKPHIVLTPKQKEGVFELILNTFESTFGWLGKMR